ncbi:MAG: hypothetical protein ABMA26_06355 [Limisphaerales bacterium]
MKFRFLPSGFLQDSAEDFFFLLPLFFPEAGVFLIARRGAFSSVLGHDEFPAQPPQVPVLQSFLHA